VGLRGNQVDVRARSIGTHWRGHFPILKKAEIKHQLKLKMKMFSFPKIESI